MWINSLFGGLPDAVKFVVYFLLVLGLIGAAAYLWRQLQFGSLGAIGPRSRQPRLAVIDHANVDGRRRLILIRRDNTEHLLMIGGPTDIVIEPNINRAPASAAAPNQRPVPEIPVRSLEEITHLEPAVRPEPMIRPEPMLRPEPMMRPEPVRPEPMVRPEPLARAEPTVRPIPPARPAPVPAAESLFPGLMPPPLPDESDLPPRPAVPAPPAYEPVFRTEPEVRRPTPMREPLLGSLEPEPEWTALKPPSILEPTLQPPPEEPLRIAPAPAPAAAAAAPARAAQSDENNLIEMAQRLEAALRRPTRPVEPPLPPQRAVRTEPASRVSAYFETPMPGGAAFPAAAPAVEVKPPPVPAQLEQAEDEPPQAFGSLEEEMASLLGRPPGKT